MHLQPGTVAPDFEATTLDGRKLQLRSLRGKRVWIAFFRYASCPLCNYRIHELITEWPKRFAPHDFVMLGIFQSPAGKLDAVTERHTPPFEIIPDPEMQLYQQYGLEHGIKAFFGQSVHERGQASRKAGFPFPRTWDGPITRMPADFLLDADGVIQRVFYGRTIAEHIPFVDVSSFLER